MEDYERLWQVADGAQGRVFHVRHRKTHKEYALKQIRCKDHNQVNFALKEIKVLMELRHPNIVSYTDFFMHFEETTVKNAANISVCLVMELCEHGDLQEKIKLAKEAFMDSGRHAYTERQVVAWLRQCADALKYIHEKGFLHRDLKPTNVLFSVDDCVKLGDFGLATSVGPGRHSAVGTPYYFAPEVMLKQTYNSKVDVWGLGVVVLELLTLRERPINSQVLEDANAVESVVKDITDMGFTVQLAVLVRDMLQRYPQGRPSPAVILQRLNCDAVPRGMPTATPDEAAARPDDVALPRSVVVAGSTDANANVARAKPPMRPLVSVNCLLRPADIAPVSAHPVRPSPVSSPENATPSDGECTAETHEQPPAPRPHAAPVPTERNPSPTVPLAPALPPGPRPAAGESGQANVAARLVSSKRICVPGDCPLLVDAIQLAADGDAIIVAAGTVTSQQIVIAKSITVEGDGHHPKPSIVTNDQTCVVLDGVRGRFSGFTVREVRNAHNHSGTDRPSGIEIRKGQWEIAACSVECPSGSCVSVTTPQADPAVTACVLMHARQAGVLVCENGRSLFSKTEICQCGYAAALLKHNSTVRMVECTFADNRETGVFCHGAQAVLENNEITRNKGCGIVVKGGARPIIRRNRIHDNLQAGIFCCDHGGGTISDNDIFANMKAGILVKTGGDPTIVRNKIYSGKETGLYVFDSGAGTVEGNDIYDNANAGILVTTGGNPTVVGNRITRKPV